MITIVVVVVSVGDSIEATQGREGKKEVNNCKWGEMMESE